MTSPSSSPSDPALDPVFAQASDWFARHQAGPLSGADRAAFAQWRLADPAHAQAWREVEALWGVSGAVSDAPEIRALRESAREGLETQRPAFVWGTWGAAAAGLAACFMIAMVLWGQTPSQPVADAPIEVAQVERYQTGAGMRENLNLSDGTAIFMDAQTRFSAHYSETERSIRLEDGRARFEVERDETRVFSVQTPVGGVRVLGTQFDVSYRDAVMQVALYEGSLAVAAQGDEVILEPGQRIEITSAGLSAVSAVAYGADLWREGILMFRSAPLQDVVDELNRQASSNIVLMFEPTPEDRFTGRLNAGALRPAAEALSVIFGLEIEAQPNGDLHLYRTL